MAESAALAGYFQAIDSPREWGQRTKHVFRSTIMTRTDSGGETLATWRPDRVNTHGLSLREGLALLGFDALASFRSEFGDG